MSPRTYNKSFLASCCFRKYMICSLKTVGVTAGHTNYYFILRNTQSSNAYSASDGIHIEFSSLVWKFVPLFACRALNASKYSPVLVQKIYPGRVMRV